MADQARGLDRRAILTMAALAAGAPAVAATVPASAAVATGDRYVKVDDLNVYCRVQGQGPLIIVQSGMWIDTLDDTMAGPFSAKLAKTVTVLTFDARGQGRTNAGTGRISYGRFAADTVRLMDVLGIEKAHFFGHSDGGCIGLHLLVDFPDRLITATLSGTVFNLEGYRRDSQEKLTEAFQDMKAGTTRFPEMQLPAVKDAYARHAPEPRRLMEMLIGQRDCWVTEPSFSVRQLARIHTPVLVIDAGRDPYMPSESFKLLASSIPAARRVEHPAMAHDFADHYDAVAADVAAFALA
jgi:pimeloyl-ACP methyl ester carboxylesterase